MKVLLKVGFNNPFKGGVWHGTEIAKKDSANRGHDMYKL